MDITVELEAVPGKGEYVVLRFPYSERMTNRAKTIPAARWSRDVKGWCYPLDLVTCRLLRETFPTLTIGPKLTSWARREVSRNAQRRIFHSTVSAEPARLSVVERDAPTMYAAMQQRGYQTLVPAFAQRVGNYFNASQPGAGKTIETLASLVECEVGPRVLIIAPKKAIQATWPKEVDRWVSPDMPVSVLVCDDEQGDMAVRDQLLAQYAERVAGRCRGAARFEFVMINPEMLRWEFTCVNPACNGKRKTCDRKATHEKRPLYPSLFKVKWDCVVMDETHKMMMNANERSANVSGWGFGAQHLLVNKTAKLNKIGMSGTPFKGNPRKFWTMLHWLNKEKYPSRHKWERVYFETADDPWAYQGKRITDDLRAEREELFNADLDSIMIRHTKAELRKINPAWAPPEKVHVDVKLPMAAKQKCAYKSIEEDASVRLAGGTLTANGILAERVRLKQFASAHGKMVGGRFIPSLPSNKWEWIKEALEERGLARSMNDGSVKIVIASQYVELLEVFAAELAKMGINYFTIRGKDRNVRQVEAEWQSSQRHTRVLLLSGAAGGTSLTLDAADDLVLVDEAENPDDNEQIEDRVHRTSRTDHQVTIYHLQSEGTIDEWIANDNIFADIEQKRLLDERRGVSYGRRSSDA